MPKCHGRKSWRGGDELPNLEWEMLVQIVPRFCHVLNNFKHQIACITMQLTNPIILIAFDYFPKFHL